jgi:pyruvate,water dikinase
VTISPLDGTVEEVGGKAHGLARLIQMGLPVPPAVVVPVSARGQLDEDPAEIVRWLGEPLAVRSSGVGEDAADRSAAGQYESVMGVGAETLREAVERVWRSGDSERARAYRGDAETAMAVVIQREVRSSRAGVAFSRDPVGSGGEALIECVFGHGERLVSGLADPDRYWVGAEGDVRARLAVKEEPYRLLRTLRDDEVQTVAAMSRKAEAGYGRPVDVEFCFEATDLWLVQCRAVTTPAVGDP